MQQGHGPRGLAADGALADTHDRGDLGFRQIGVIPQDQDFALSGTTLQVTCQIQGATMTNEDRASPGIARNRNGITSSRWYWCTLLNGAAGYLPEVYVAAAYRGGQGLPTC